MTDSPTDGDSTPTDDSPTDGNSTPTDNLAPTNSDSTPTDGVGPSSAAFDDWRVLVPVAVMDGQTIAPGVAELLATLPVTVMGYHELPEQTATEQAREQFEGRAQTALDEIAQTFRTAGGEADTRLVFTHDADQTTDRVRTDAGCGAVLHPNPTGPVERLLVPLTPETTVPRLAAFLAALIGGRSIHVTLLHTASESATDEPAAAHLADCGVPTDQISRETTTDDISVAAVVEAATDHDAVVLDHTAPSLGTVVFGEHTQQIADRSIAPVLAVHPES